MADPKKILGGLSKIGRALTATDDEARLAELLSHGGDKTLPLMLPRANLSSDFINQQAERVARQMLGEHVVSGKPKETFNLAGRSKKESERVKGLDYKLTPTGTVAEEVPYTPRRGDLKVAFPGDQTVSNKVLEEINGFPIDSVQEGGAYYGLGQKHLDVPEFWKSNEVPAKGIQSKIDRAAELFEPDRVIGSHLAMGPTSNNFAMHFADANLRAIDWSKAQPKKINQFDSIIANGYKDPKTGELVTFPHWPGLADREGALAAMKNDSDLRKWFNNRMKVPSVTEPLGLPNGLDIQYAITEPRLRDMEINMTGLMTGELKPGSLVEAAGNPHNTYTHRILGEAGGPQEVLTPFVIDFPDAAQHIASTKRPSDFTGTIQKVFPHQLVDDQYINQYNQYRDRIKELTGQKEGGAVDDFDSKVDKLIEDHHFDSRLHSMIESHMADGGVPHMADAGRVVKGATKAFKKLFSDDVLPMATRDANLASFLEPSKIQQRLYHGTTATEGGKGTEAIKRIKASKEGALGSGVYLTPSSAHASGYSGIPNDAALDAMRANNYGDMADTFMADRAKGTLREGQAGGNMLPVHAQIKNPLVIEGTHGDPMIEALTKLGMDEDKASALVERAYENKGYIGKEVESRARAAGYDGLAQYRNGELSEVVAYDPNTVKSAIGNRGTYDLNEPDLNKADGGKIVKGAAKAFKKLFEDDVVNGMRVRTDIPNLSSIGASLDNYSTHGLQEVPMSAFETVGKPRYRSVQERERTQELARQIQQNKELNPLIVVKDAEGHYILEGGHRFDALRELDIDSFPALMVHDLDSLAEQVPVVKAEGGLLHMADAGRVVKGLGKLGKKLFSDPEDMTAVVRGGTRRFGDEIGGNSIIKETGGNWLGGEVEKQLKRLQMGDTVPKQDIEKLKGSIDTAKRVTGRDATVDRAIRQMENELDVQTRNNALNAWMESNLTNYVKKQMGTADDPVRKLAEQDILHMEPFGNADAGRLTMKKRAGLGYPYQGVGESDKAKFWERLSDSAIDPYPAGSYKHGSLDESILANNPWLQKVSDETMINSAKGLTRDLGFDHIIDVLRQDVREGRIRPEQLNKVSMEQAVRRTHEYDQEMAKKMRETQAKVTEGMPTHKEYPEGYKWIELTESKDLPKGWSQDSAGVYLGPNGERTIINPSRENLDSALKYEGNTMGHCVGSYCDDVAGGKSRIYSLRDAKGEPHVTVEVKPHEGWFTTADKMPDPSGKNKSFHELIDNERLELAQQKGGYGNIGESYEDTANRLARQYQLEAKPEIIQIKGKQNRAPKEEYLPFVQDFVKSGDWSRVGDLQNTGLKPYKGAGDLKYVTPEEYNIELQKELGLLPPAEGMAQGGGVFKKLQFMDKGGLTTSGGTFSPEDLGVNADDIGLSKEQWEAAKRNAPIIARKAGKMAKDELLDEYNQFKSLRGVKDFALRTSASYLGGIPDLVNLGLMIPDAVIGTNLASEKPWFGSEQYMEKMKQAGMLGENEFPLAEIAAGILAPAGMIKKGIKKGSQLFRGAKEASEIPKKRVGGLTAMAR